MNGESSLTTIEYVNKKIKHYSLTCKSIGDQLIFYENRVPTSVLFITKSRDPLYISQYNRRAMFHKKHLPELRIGLIILETSNLSPSLFRFGKHIDFFSTISEVNSKKIQKEIVKIILEEIFNEN